MLQLAKAKVEEVKSALADVVVRIAKSFEITPPPPVAPQPEKCWDKNLVFAEIPL